ncbi:hypothetical protein HQ33_03775 [Limosilactobacillus reuteri]|uniref:Uncharacterized protein n=1 Tax=Limosilactobacillus reuteri TaxID=1598 RepID=A0A073JK26_LIMRT|nr:hypothetical protein LR3_00240 [Limosilactobacillus reuteri]KEK16176.1 hypothetical protein HQ33_03775 [Limosilactobacillus reuteri]
MKDEQKHSLVEDHALKRLHKVEKEKRKPYVKHKNGFQFQNVFMAFLFLVILIVMLAGIL